VQVSRKLVVLVIGLLFSSLFIVDSGKASGRIVDDGWTSPDLPLQGYVNVTFAENAGGPVLSPGAPYLVWRGNQSNGIEESALCSSVNDTRCSEKYGSLTYMTRLAQCSSSNDLDCIESLTLIQSDKTINGLVNETFPKTIKTTYEGNPSISLPKASSGQTWSFPGFTHVGGNLFFVNAILAGSKNFSESQFSPVSLSISVNAVDFRPTTRDDGSSFANENRGTFGTKIGAVGIYPPYENERYSCVMSGDFLCANRREMPEGVEFKISLRLASSPSGWLHGRIRDASVIVENLQSSGAVRLVIQGKTQRIPTLGFSYPWREVPKTIQDQYLNGEFSNEGSGPTKGCRWCSSDPLINTLTSNPLSYGPDALQEFQSWIKLRGDKSDADLNTWSVRTLSEAEMNDVPACFAKKNQLSGFVSTNSTIYSAGPPKLVRGSLDYVVAAPHFLSSGEETRGQYRLIIRSDVARCVYGFSQAPISATVSVTNSDGTSQIASTSVSESNGWLTLNANNFTFSAPTIRVVIDGTVVAPTPTPTPTPSIVATPTPSASPSAVANPTPSVASTPQATPSAIKPLVVKTTCIKGKITKVVIGKKCPAGYKKK